MNPGQACITCHTRGEGPRFAFAGTVFGTGASHEVDNCFGRASATVRVIGADGTTLTTTTGPSGNFSFNQTVPLPYIAEVELDGFLAGAGFEGVEICTVHREKEPPHFETVLAVGVKAA